MIVGHQPVEDLAKRWVVADAVTVQGVNLALEEEEGEEEEQVELAVDSK